MNINEIPQVNEEPRPFNSGISSGPGGSIFSGGEFSSAFQVKKNGWKLNEDGSINVDIINFLDAQGVLRSTLEGVDVENEGVDGLLIRTIAGTGIYEYLFSSAGFLMPGGSFEGTITVGTGAGVVLGTTGMSGHVGLVDNLRTGSEYQLEIVMGATIASTTNSVTQKIPVYINGVQYYLLATTSAS